MDGRGQNPVGYKEEYDTLIQAGDIVLLWTGHSVNWGTDCYYAQHPVLGEELVEFLIQRRIRLLGMDLPRQMDRPLPCTSAFWELGSLGGESD